MRLVGYKIYGNGLMPFREMVDATRSTGNLLLVCPIGVCNLHTALSLSHPQIIRKTSGSQIVTGAIMNFNIYGWPEGCFLSCHKSHLELYILQVRVLQ